MESLLFFNNFLINNKYNYSIRKYNVEFITPYMFRKL